MLVVEDEIPLDDFNQGLYGNCSTLEEISSGLRKAIRPQRFWRPMTILPLTWPEWSPIYREEGCREITDSPLHNHNIFFAVYSSVIKVSIIPVRNAPTIASTLFVPHAIATTCFVFFKFFDLFVYNMFLYKRCYSVCLPLVGNGIGAWNRYCYFNSGISLY